MIFNPNQVHQTKSITGKSFGYYGLHINLQWCIDIQTKLFGFNKTFIDTKVNIINKDDIHKNLKRIFMDILINSQTSFNKELEEILVNILKDYTEINNICETDKKEHKLLNEVEKYILENIEEQITLNDLSLKVGYNESYITRIFRKKFGLTPHAFIVNKKANHIKSKLLNSKNISISELSHEVGFYDQSHLGKVFKRIYAISPNKYINEK